MRKHGLISKNTSEKYYQIATLFLRLFCPIPVSIYYTIAITSFINTIQSRKLKHPLLVASRYVSLTSSLFSVFTLQTIMLQTFNTKNE
ncbi:hypothetical protein ACQRC9_12325, partial [Streptococcus orisratti]